MFGKRIQNKKNQKNWNKIGETKITLRSYWYNRKIIFYIYICEYYGLYGLELESEYQI